MKKLLATTFVVMLLGTSMCYGEYVKEGNTFVNTASSGRTTRNLVITPYKYRPNKNKPDEYYIWINTNNGACYIKRVSKTSGKERYDRIKDEDLCKQVAKSLGVEYSYKPRNKK